MATAGGKAAATGLANRAVDFMMRKIHEAHEKITIESGAAFDAYLKNAYDALNWKRTLASGYESLCIIDKNNMGENIGENSMYVDIGAYYTTPNGKEHNVDTSNVKTILSANKHEDKIIVDGTGGAGKSMLMRYLFVDTVSRNAGDYVPVYMELTKLPVDSKLLFKSANIKQFVRQSMEDYGKISLSGNVFDYSLEQGGYVFLFDGFDEVKEEDADKVLDALQKFSAKYSNNAFIISSRERLRLRSLSSFQIIHTKELSKGKAIELAQKFPGHPDTISKFCKNLKDSWFREYNGFAKSPLLLTMMFITFEQNGDISNCLPDFYQDCFDALYNKHDTVHKVGFRRTFHCSISKREFQAVFSYFCFHTWRKEIYDFSEDEILNWLEKSLKKQNLSVSAEDYLKDLTDSLCIITCEGHRYRFAHRSFQTYFAAKYTCSLSDQQQKEFLMDKFHWNSIRHLDNNYLDLLNQVDHERFLNNFIEPVLQDMLSICHTEQKFCANTITLYIFDKKAKLIINPIISFFLQHVNINQTLPLDFFRDKNLQFSKFYTIIRNLCMTHPEISQSGLVTPSFSINLKILLDYGGFLIDLNQLLESNTISQNDKNIIFEYILNKYPVSKLYQVITDWLAEREAARQKPSSDDKFADY